MNVAYGHNDARASSSPVQAADGRGAFRRAGEQQRGQPQALQVARAHLSQGGRWPLSQPEMGDDGGHPGIYYLVPWMRWDRGPSRRTRRCWSISRTSGSISSSSRSGRRKSYYITGLLILSAVSLFLVNALFGRLWCGYACPQTVWTDLFIWVETRIEGDRSARIRLAAAPWTAGKVAKRVAKHAIWLLIAVATGGAWVFYFNDAPTLLHQLVHGRRQHRRLCGDRGSDLHHLFAWRAHARAGLHLYVPLAAHPGRDDGQRSAWRHLSPGSRRTARCITRRASPGRAAALASIAINALRPVRWASTFATARSWNASIAACASTPATR